MINKTKSCKIQNTKIYNHQTLEIGGHVMGSEFNRINAIFRKKEALITRIYIYIYTYIYIYHHHMIYIYISSDDIYIYRYMYIYHHHHHHIVPVALISLTLSRLFFLSFIASGRSSGLHPIFSQNFCMFELVVLLLLGHMWGSIGVHHL